MESEREKEMEKEREQRKAGHVCVEFKDEYLSSFKRDFTMAEVLIALASHLQAQADERHQEHQNTNTTEKKITIEDVLRRYRTEAELLSALLGRATIRPSLRDRRKKEVMHYFSDYLTISHLISPYFSSPK